MSRSSLQENSVNVSKERRKRRPSGVFDCVARVKVILLEWEVILGCLIPFRKLRWRLGCNTKGKIVGR